MPQLTFAMLIIIQGNDPTALSVLTQAITGQVGFMDTEFCTACGGKGASKRCSICKMVSVYTDMGLHGSVCSSVGQKIDGSGPVVARVTGLSSKVHNTSCSQNWQVVLPQLE